MATSTPRLSEYARKFAFPQDRIVKTVWPRVEAKGAELGLGFDWWQQQLGTVCLGYGKDGKYVATVGGIGMSIPRQVGKTYFVLALLVIMCILFPGLQVVWTAHHLRTSTKTFTTLRGICRRKKVAPHIALNERGKPAIRSANGEQEVLFANGSKIMFGARSMGFGRGFDEVDIEVFDEAQILDTKALEDMIAATNQARHEHGALLFYMGTPPRPGDPSEDFEQRRAEAHDDDLDDAIWLEIGADPQSDINDRSQWPLMNPSFPKRTPLESMLRLRKNLKNDDSWNREGRGVWDEDGAGWQVFPSLAWRQAKRDARRLDGAPSLAIAASPDLAWAAIGAANTRSGKVWGRVLAHGPGVAWVAAEAKRLQKKHNVAIVLDKGGPCSSLIEELEAAGVNLSPINGAGTCDAAALLHTAVTERGTFRHMGDPELTEAARIAEWRNIGDRRAFGRRVGNIAPLEAVSLAVADALANDYDIDDSVG